MLGLIANALRMLNHCSYQGRIRRNQHVRVRLLPRFQGSILERTVRLGHPMVGTLSGYLAFWTWISKLRIFAVPAIEIHVNVSYQSKAPLIHPNGRQ
ncbi:uncharacterized protein BO96DRAFT_469553 [Aspergillus niger CBS 101883]|uniref:Uncharacterized protein n=2 Tax=Aspergillus niger TaxID=5061 RepID=A2QA71_ASPNC|nr:uncharacterized protein BO96DRAFT_469553 [Aspergillus niger CBS 101883]XP_059599753.1 hypothetical protein An01g10420 [Aspergillus niger]PYH52101.1 hypothetical protein BO96DRAFT_469553 [Aspergillus niger CBS 101883]CAK37223.1 hypothetical protein An01g10420 [Aspergillus niger]